MTPVTVPHAGELWLVFRWTREQAIDVLSGAPASDCPRFGARS
jgi:hypothetical protein